MEKQETQTIQFSDPIQRKILALLLSDQETLARASTYLVPENFDNPIHQDFAKIIFDYFRKYCKPIKVDEFLEELDTLLKRNHNLPVDEYLKTAQEMLQEAKDGDSGYIKDKLIYFARHAAIKRAILEGVEIVQKGKDNEEILKMVEAAVAIGKEENPLAIVRADQIEEKSLEWFWHNRIPKRAISLVVGNPGVGKSYFSAWMAAQVSRGHPWPTDPSIPEEAGNVL